jgi:sigma-B regulation protein RsbU (phosphoserine phosphatase)
LIRWPRRALRGRLAAHVSQDPEPAGLAPPPRPGGALRQSLPGRLFLLSGGLLLPLLLIGRLVELPELVQTFRRVLAVALFFAVAWLAIFALVRDRRRLLWRVRRKLILSYVFLGVVPVVLMAAFALAGGVVLYNNVAVYLFREGVREIETIAEHAARLTAPDGLTGPAAARAALERLQPDLVSLSPGASSAVLVVPADGDAQTSAPLYAPVLAEVGPWRHTVPPEAAPAWLVSTGAFAGLVASGAGASNAEAGPPLTVRAAALSPDRRRLVVIDLPLDAALSAWIRERSGTTITAIALGDGERASPAALADGSSADSGGAEGEGFRNFFQRTVGFVDYVDDWERGSTGRASIRLDAPLGELYGQLISAQPPELASVLGGRWGGFVLALIVLGALFLVIQGSALVMGALLARSITSAVHEMFVGTERVRQGEFGHRIRIESRDQLGELAESFNRMSGSIEHLLHVQRQKQRLDDELRIAREIQKSLLPVEPPRLAGLQIADLCEPAREVGGDYYDFFVLGPRQLGVVVADVAGKGTSAALYMAELKGLMLALSHGERSPRRLLVDLNELLVRQLDTRSFITMAYGVIDLDAGTLTCARAGHTPPLVVSGGRTETLMPGGMVLGLQLPGAREMFGTMLEEQTRAIAAGDVVVLYTDGLTEAMNRDGELFGDAALARILASLDHLEAAAIRERLIREVKAFVGDAEPHDDLTLVVLKVAPPAGAAG